MSSDTDAALTAALHNWRAEPVDARALARLEQQLSAALLTPRAATRPLTPPPSAWLLGLWAVHAALALLLSSHGTRQELAPDTAAPPAMLSALEAASRLGVGPRELAAGEAMDPLHGTHWR